MKDEIKFTLLLIGKQLKTLMLLVTLMRLLCESHEGELLMLLILCVPWCY